MLSRIPVTCTAWSGWDSSKLTDCFVCWDMTLIFFRWWIGQLSEWSLVWTGPRISASEKTAILLGRGWDFTDVEDGSLINVEVVKVTRAKIRA